MAEAGGGGEAKTQGRQEEAGGRRAGRVRQRGREGTSQRGRHSVPALIQLTATDCGWLPAQALALALAF